MNNKYDVVIIGGGVSGLHAAAVLAKNNYKVCVLEKHSKLGGGLHNFSRKGKIFDTGVHYISSLGRDKPLGKLYNYLGITNQLRFLEMDKDGFDVVIRSEDDNQYPIAADKDLFIKNLSKYFPDDKEDIKNYYENLETESNLIPCHNFKNIGVQIPMDLYTESVSAYLERTIKNPDLRDVIAGNNFMYAGQKSISPWSIHLLALSSYAQGAYRFINGSQQLSNVLRKFIIDNGGVVEKNAEVITCTVEDKKVTNVSTKHEQYQADFFISSIHPQALLPMLPEGSLRKIYRERVMGIENLPSCFGLYINLKKDTFPFYNNNFYYHDKGNPWYQSTTEDADWPRMYYLTTAPHTANDEYAQTLQVLAYMDYAEVAQWADSLKKERQEDYYKFKKRKAEILLKKVYEKFPNLQHSIESIEIATPLTLRDYLNSPKGSLYGIQKDANNVQKNHINHRTKIKNLYLTGQNIAAHGLVGSVMSSLISCEELIDLQKLFDDLNNG